MTDMMRMDNVESEWLDMIDECGTQASEIFEDFLDFINETPAKKATVSIARSWMREFRWQRPEMTCRIVTIHKNIPAGLEISGDESKLKRSIMNLVNNAVDALVDHKVANPRIDILAAADSDGKNVILTIRDNGGGYPAGNQQDPF
jgi:two-component system NtrC family sensor kinase